MSKTTRDDDYTSFEARKKARAETTTLAARDPNFNQEALNAQLHKAAARGSASKISELIRRGANPNSPAQAPRYLPIHHAANRGHWEAIAMLIDMGAHPDGADINGSAAMHHANAHPKSVMVLVSKQASVELRNNDGFTALHLAAKHGQIATLEYLASVGADINSKDNIQRCPIIGALGGNHVNAVKVLLELGADVGARDCDENTSLHHAGVPGLVPAIRLLMDAGSDVLALDHLGRIPAQIADAHKHPLASSVQRAETSHI